MDSLCVLKQKSCCFSVDVSSLNSFTCLYVKEALHQQIIEQMISMKTGKLNRRVSGGTEFNHIRFQTNFPRLELWFVSMKT